MEQYFTENPSTKNDIYKFDWNIGQNRFYFCTSNSVFSKTGVDFGSMCLINAVIKENVNSAGSILDMGCGYGPIGVILASILNKSHITMADVNTRALELAQMNCAENKVIANTETVSSSSFDNINGNYDIIVTNPPIRAGKSVVFSFYEGAFEHLNVNGSFYVVIQKKQGAPSTKEKLISLFGNCETVNKQSGYFVFKSIKY